MVSHVELIGILAYIFLMPGLVFRAMFLFNRCLYWDTVISLATALFFFSLTIPNLIQTYKNPSTIDFFAPTQFMLIGLAFFVLFANVIDIYRLIVYRNRKKHNGHENANAY